MAQTAADRNLLFGVLALQLDFINREQLIAAMQAWVFDKNKPLGEILCAQKALAEDNHALLEALVRKHLAQHGNDPEKSLAAVSSINHAREELQKIADPDIQASLVHVSAARVNDLDIYATSKPVSSQPASASVRFRILRPHARGGLGQVFVAHDEELHREVALKEIQERHADNPESRGRFLVEGEITGGLEHPGIVPVYGLGTYADGRPYYAMRFVRGDSLEEAIDRFHKTDAAGMNPGQRTLELRALLGRLIDVCNAIAYAHNRGVLHRDLKPGNIMLGKYGETLVVDWGLAKPLGKPVPDASPTGPGEGSLIVSSIGSASQTQMGSAIGTPQYMSPEQAAGRLDLIGPASDVYSLGATLFFLLTGRPPVSEKDVGVVLKKVERGEIATARAVKPDVPEPLEAVCQKAMALKPEDRYSSPRLLADDLEHWLADEPVSAWKEPWTVKARRWLGRHRTLVTGVSAAVLVAVVGLTIATILLTAANEREREARGVAEANELETKRQKEQADKNFRLARAAVDRYHTEVSESILLNEPGMGPLRKKLLEAAREYYAKFVQERADDLSVRAELGKATYRLAQITGDIDSPQKAIALHEQAVKVFETLPAAQVNADTQADLADCWTQLSRLYLKNDQKEKAEAVGQQALGAWQRLRDQHPKEERYLAGLARAELYLGNAFQYNRQLDDAHKFYQQSLATRIALSQMAPKVAEYQRDLAICHNNLALINWAKGSTKDAEKEYREALSIQSQLADAAPHISQYQDDLARTHANLGDLLVSAVGTDSAKGVKEYVKALDIRKKLAERHPSFIEYQVMLSEAWIAVSRANIRVNELKKAEAAVQEALTIQRRLAVEHKDVPARQFELGDGLFALAETYRAAEKTKQAVSAYQEAVEVQDKLVATLPKVLPYQAALARSYQGLGLTYLGEKKFALAANALEQAVTRWERLVKEKPNEFEYLLGLTKTQVKQAVALAKLGKHREASKIIDPLATTHRGDALYEFAAIYSLCCAAADNPKLADHYTTQALKVLAAAQKVDFFNTPAHREKLTTDPDLEALRERPDFTTWRNKLERK